MKLKQSENNKNMFQYIKTVIITMIARQNCINIHDCNNIIIAFPEFDFAKKVEVRKIVIPFLTFNEGKSLRME